jgi:hypothetical protein
MVCFCEDGSDLVVPIRDKKFFVISVCLRMEYSCVLL